MERRYIDGSNGRIQRQDLYLVNLTLSDGTVFEELEPRRLFPFTSPDQYITLLDKDGHEVAVVRAIKHLDAASATALSAALAEFYMIPKIEKLLSVEDVNGTIKWCVLTDRGEIEFRIHNRNSDIKRRHGSKQVLIRDANDNRYLIPDCTAMDRHSKHLLYAYL